LLVWALLLDQIALGAGGGRGSRRWTNTLFSTYSAPSFLLLLLRLVPLDFLVPLAGRRRVEEEGRKGVELKITF
jgi:hypothetical protein